jgi:hypothetical protein
MDHTLMATVALTGTTPVATVTNAIAPLQSDLVALCIVVGGLALVAAGIAAFVAPRQWTMLAKGGIICIALAVLAGPFATWLQGALGG